MFNSEVSLVSRSIIKCIRIMVSQGADVTPPLDNHAT